MTLDTELKCSHKKSKGQAQSNLSHQINTMHYPDTNLFRWNPFQKKCASKNVMADKTFFAIYLCQRLRSA